MTKKEVEILETLKAKMRRGDINDIAKLTGLSRQHISRCLSPSQDKYSEEMVEAATKVIDKRDKKRKSQLSKIKKILE